MKLVRFILVSCLLWLWLGAIASAAGDAPPVPAGSPLAAPQPTAPADSAPPVEDPTSPVVSNPPPESSPPPVSSPAPDSGSSPITVTQEQNPQPTAPAAVAPPVAQPSSPRPSSPPASSSSSGAPPDGASAPPPSDGVTNPPSTGSIDTSGTDTSSVVDVNAPATGAAAPAQLRCGKRLYPTSGPFLSSPFGGWSSINSFLDHDNPDYRVDGTIVLANGMRASATSGQASDVFPAYWSPGLRQYVNYDGHNGYDFGVSYQPILAAGDGTVEYAGWNGPSPYMGYGQMVLIDHHNGYVTLYGHLSSLEVQKGDQVVAGEEIGISGTTGNSSGPHLHFSVFHNCNVTDPYGWTGKGSDPLTDFDGEKSSYLWLPGHDPLALNTPPDWPSYPLGLKIVLPPSIKAHGHLSPRALPPVDRLLLLDLPAPGQEIGLSAGTALARTDSLITQEQLALAPYLDALKAQHVIDAYEAIPAAAAVWVRGTASSAQLEALPGIASLSGVQPNDLKAAEAGLAHSVLIQLGAQQAPSLWPVGFRSALHAWRPVITAVNGHALVEGFVLPGDHVIVSLKRNGMIAAAADSTGDADTGGFVAMLHDENGVPVNVRTGDEVQVQTAGKSAGVTVAALSVRAHSRSVAGTARAGSTVPLVALAPDGTVTWHSVATANSLGHFSARLPHSLPAGSLAVASVSDAGGDGESATSHIPGMVVDLAGQQVTGWALNRTPTFQVWRAGKEVFSQPIFPTTEGAFHLALKSGAVPFALLPGDVVSIGSAWHRHRLQIPRLAVTLASGSRAISIVGPAHQRLLLSLLHAGAHSSLSESLGTTGRSLAHTSFASAVGDSATLIYQAPSGDSVSATATIHGLQVHTGNGQVTGEESPGAQVRVTVASSSGRAIGSGEAWPDPTTGDFSLLVRGGSGRAGHLPPGARITIEDASGTVAATIPRVDVQVQDARTISISHADVRRIDIAAVGAKGSRHVRVETSATGTAQVQLGAVAPLRSITLTSAEADGLSFVRKLVLHATGCRASTRPRCAPSSITRVHGKSGSTR